MLTKSNGANIRVWNLSSHASNPSLRLPYEDIPNTADFKAFYGDFAFGGLYDLQVLDHVAYSSAKKTAVTKEERKMEEEKEADVEKENVEPHSSFDTSFDSSVVVELSGFKEDNINTVGAPTSKNSGAKLLRFLFIPLFLIHSSISSSSSSFFVITFFLCNHLLLLPLPLLVHLHPLIEIQGL